MQEYANQNGYILNPDSVKLRSVLKGLNENTTKYGQAYCPCRVRTGNAVEDQKIICPCAYHKDEIALHGVCHCNLFYKNTQTTQPRTRRERPNRQR
jgi:ferredoxin-thioredoxin reductase catalytic subunit